VDLRIYDVSGRQVRGLTRQLYDAGTHELVWDGKDDLGRAAASGVYFLRMEAGGYRAARTVVLRR
jgi:flagellar hook assembly protein FlgD